MITQNELREFFKKEGISRAKVIKRPHYLEVRVPNKFKLKVGMLLLEHPDQFSFEVKKLGVLESRFTKIVFTKGVVTWMKN